jgi:acyl-CoA thioesterase-1
MVKLSNLFFISISIIMPILNSCGESKEAMRTSENQFTYLALGDSYTIGESVAEELRWPNLLTKDLRAEGVKVNDAKIIAKTGWRTDQLIDAAKDSERFAMVSLLIGVNNQYQKKSIETFKKEFNVLFDMTIQLSFHEEKGVFVLSIPDYGITSYVSDTGPHVSKDLIRWNESIKMICKKRGILYFNTTEISKLAKKDSSLLADDGLHPSGKIYQMWVDAIKQDVKKRFTSF